MDGRGGEGEDAPPLTSFVAEVMQAAAMEDAQDEAALAAEDGDVITDLDAIVAAPHVAAAPAPARRPAQPAASPSSSSAATVHMDEKPPVRRMPSLELDVPGETDVDTLHESRGQESDFVIRKHSGGSMDEDDGSAEGADGSQGPFSAPKPKAGPSVHGRQTIILEEDMMPVSGVQEDFSSQQKDGANGSVAAAAAAADTTHSDTSAAAADETDLFLSGRVGHADCINGRYALIRDQRHDDHPVFRHVDPIPPGFANDSGKHLWLMYHRENDAWAIATEFASLDVLAYVLGDILDPNASVFDATWYISSGEGDYTADSNVIVTGNAVPKRRSTLFDEAVSIPEPSQEFEEEEEEEEAGEKTEGLPAAGSVTSEGDVFQQPRPEAVMEEPVVDASNARVNALKSEGGKPRAHSWDSPLPASSAQGSRQPHPPATTPEKAQSAANQRSRSSSTSFRDGSDAGSDDGNFERTRRSSMSRLGRSISKPFRRIPGGSSVRRTIKGTKVRLQRLSGRETPAESLRRTVAKMRLCRGTEERLMFAKELQKALQRGKNRKDTLAAVRSALINAWGLCLQALQGAPPETWDTYFEVLLTIMIRDELQISTLNSSTAQESWVSACCRLIWQTHEYVVGHLSGVITQEHLLLFCAKVLAINYLQVPGLAQVIVRAVVRATPIVGRRSYKIGQRVADRAVRLQKELARHLPSENKNQIYNLHNLCGVEIKGREDQCGSTLPRSQFHHPFAVVTTPAETQKLIGSFASPHAADLCSEKLWLGHRATGGRWTARFVTRTDAGFGFLSVFLEVLMRRARSVLSVSYFASKAEQKLGIHKKVTTAHVFIPGYTELTSSFLRLSLTTELALKRTYNIGYGPPSLVCNWSDRTAAAALAMSHGGVFFSCLLEDLMLQTSLAYVADVMSLLGSFKALLESFVRMHDEPVPEHLDAAMMVDFLQRLYLCPHYVVKMFSLRWTYECLDFFPPPTRAAICGLLMSGDVLPTLLCHWESNVRHLYIAVILFRFAPPSNLMLQTSMLDAIHGQLEQPHDSLDGYRELPLSVFHEGEGDELAKLAKSQRVHLKRFRDYIQHMICSHIPGSGPPYLSENLKPFLQSHDRQRRPQHTTLYSSQALEQLRTSVTEARTWVQKNRVRAEKDEAFPPINVTLPPLQKLTSMYSQSRPARF